MASGSPRAAAGVTGADGTFELSTFGKNDGAVVGTHTVTITKIQSTVTGEGMSPDNPEGGYGEAMAQAARQAEVKTELPSKYANPETSGLTAEVTESGPNEFTFELE
jgi:hypothetical protein